MTALLLTPRKLNPLYGARPSPRLPSNHQLLPSLSRSPLQTSISVNDSSRIFHLSAAQPASTAAPGLLPISSATSTTSAPPAATTAVPPTLPPRAAPAQAALPPTTTSTAPPAHPASTASPTSPSSATHHSTLAGGRDHSRVSSQSERSGRSIVVQDGLYPISAFVLKQGGAYQAYVTVRWTTSEGRSGVTERLGHSIGFNHVGSRSLRDKGVPEGARVRIALEVLLGKHSEAIEEFVYDSRAMTSAFYVSRGTSLTSSSRITITTSRQGRGRGGCSSGLGLAVVNEEKRGFGFNTFEFLERRTQRKR